MNMNTNICLLVWIKYWCGGKRYTSDRQDTLYYCCNAYLQLMYAVYYTLL